MLLGQFSDSPAAVAAQLLIDLGLAVDPSAYSGTSTVWCVSINQGLDAEDSAVEVRDTEPRRFGRVQVTGEESQLWGIQVTVRAANDVLCYQEMNAIEVAMTQQVYMTQTTLPSGHVYRIGAVTQTSGPLVVGRETGKSKRFIRTYNFVIDLLQIS